MEIENLKKCTIAELNILAKEHNIKKISSLKKEDKINFIFDYLKISDVKYLENLKVNELNSLAKKYKIKNISSLKKQEKINGIINFFNKNNNSSVMTRPNDNMSQSDAESEKEDEDTLEKEDENKSEKDDENKSEKDDENKSEKDDEDENDSNDDNSIELDLEPLIISLRDKPKILLRKNINIHQNKVNIDYVKDVLKLNPNIGDVFQLGSNRVSGFYGKSEDKIIPLTGFYSESIYIPYEISKNFKNAFDFYYDLFEEEGINDDFFGVEIKYNDDFIKTNFGILENKYENEKIFRNNPDISGDVISIFIDKCDDQIELSMSDKWKNNYLKYINSFKYIDDIKSIYSKDNLISNIELSLKNKNDEFLTDDEEDFIYTDFPNNCLVNIDIDYGLVSITFRYNESNKEEIEDFIEKYYLSDEKEFIQYIEKSNN